MAEPVDVAGIIEQAKKGLTPAYIRGLLKALRKLPSRAERIAADLGRPDPRDFIRDVLGERPTKAAVDAGLTDIWTPDQERILVSVMENQKTAVPSGHGTGKDWIAARVVLWFLYRKPNSIVVTTAPTLRQVEIVLWGEIREARKNSKTPLPGDGTLTQLKLGDKWLAIGFTTRPGVQDITATSFQGLHAENVLVVYDEAVGLDPLILEAGKSLALRPTDRHLAIANPTDPSSWFRNACETWNCVRMSCENHPNVIHNDPDIVPGAVSREWIADKLEEYGSRESALYQAKVLGLFPEEKADTLIRLAWVERAQRIVEDEKDDGLGTVLGLDIAGEGEDLTVLWACKNRRFFVPTLRGKPAWHVGKDTMQAVALVRLALDELPNVRAIALDDSVPGDVPVIVRREGVWLDVLPIECVHDGNSVTCRAPNGMEVLSAKGWTPIVWARRHKVTKQIYDVITTDGRTKVTADHSLMVDGRETTPLELSVGTKIDTASFPKTSSLDFPTELAWALGLFAAEGSYSTSNRYQRSIARIANKRRDLLERASAAFENVFSEHGWIGGPEGDALCLRLRIQSKRFVETYCFATRTIRDWEKGEGKVSALHRHKKVPIQVLNGSRETKLAFIDGYMAGDGHKNRFEWKSDSKDLTLVAGLQVLYEQLGWPSSVRVRNDKLSITTLARLKQPHDRRGVVKRVRPLGGPEQFVYDLETESHTFVAGAGFLVHHNTGIGGGVRSRLREIQRSGGLPQYHAGNLKQMAIGHDVRIIPVNFGTPAWDKDRFLQKVDELFWHLREALEPHTEGSARGDQIYLPDDQELATYAFPKKYSMIAQLTRCTYAFPSGKIEVYDKKGRHNKAEATKHLPDQSPDIAHALILCNWARIDQRPREKAQPARTTQEIFDRQVREALDRGHKKRRRPERRLVPWRRMNR